MRVTPNGGADRIEGIEIRGDGLAVLRLRVAAVADRGRANVAVAALLAKSLGVPKTAIGLVSGERARLKTVTVAGDGHDLAQRLESLTSLKP